MNNSYFFLFDEKCHDGQKTRLKRISKRRIFTKELAVTCCRSHSFPIFCTSNNRFWHI